MAKTVTPCADLGMTSLVITLVMLMVTKSAWMGGKKILTTLKEITVLKLYAVLDVIMNMDIATDLNSANVAMVGKVPPVLIASDTLDANMVLAMSPGNVTVKKAGVAFFATKI